MYKIVCRGYTVNETRGFKSQKAFKYNTLFQPTTHHKKQAVYGCLFLMMSLLAY